MSARDPDAAHSPAGGAALLRALRWPEDAPPEDQRPAASPYYSEAGHRLLCLAAACPELRAPPGRVGIYQGLGREKMAYADPMFETVRARGFDALRPAAMIFRFSPYGAATTLAVNLRCQGPFFALEADAHAGSLTLLQALAGLQLGRCAVALCCAAVGERAWLTLLAPAAGGPGTRVAARFCHGSAGPPPAQLRQLERALGSPLPAPEQARPAGQDAHGARAAQLALLRADRGEPALLWSVTAEGRGLLMGLAPGEAGR